MSIDKKEFSVSTHSSHLEETLDPEQRRASIHAPKSLPASLEGLTSEELSKIGRSATRKTDIIVMPCLIVMYILNYLDRQNIASARLAGLPKDLKLVGTQYQTCVSILFVGYSKSIACQAPRSPANID